jgi:hypothetical protein
VRTANLSRWPKKKINKIRGVEHWWRAGQTKNKKWNACFPVSIILFPVQKISVLKRMGFLIRLHCGTQNRDYNLATNLFCIPRVYNETHQTCYAQNIQKDQWRDQSLYICWIPVPYHNPGKKSDRTHGWRSKRFCPQKPVLRSSNSAKKGLAQAAPG